MLILGAGSSGLAAARLLRAQGGSGFLVSEQPPASPPPPGFSHRPSLPESPCCRAVVSPGIPVDHPWLQALRTRHVPLTPEFALGAAGLRGRTLAITGSLGKTSMCLLAAQLLRARGWRVTVSGNIGTPVCETALTSPDADVHILELSSFQLELNEDFRADAALCLNLFPNHLDRHGTLEAYAAAKARLFAFQRQDDLACVPENYPLPIPGDGRRVRPAPTLLPPLEGTAFASGPLRRNLAALWAVLEPWGLPPDAASVVRNFRFPDFRMQELHVAGAGRVINDSKSTCLSATLAAVEAAPGRLHLVVGGLPKGEDPAPAGEVLARREVHVYLYGAAANALHAAWSPLLPHCEKHPTLPACLEAIWMRRKAGETLLFSPGCASFDQYPGYAARGTHFNELVTALAEREPLYDPSNQEPP